MSFSGMIQKYKSEKLNYKTEVKNEKNRVSWRNRTRVNSYVLQGIKFSH